MTTAALDEAHLIDTVDRFINDACETGNAETLAGLVRAVTLAAVDTRTDAYIGGATDTEAAEVYRRTAQFGAQFISELTHPSEGALP